MNRENWRVVTITGERAVKKTIYNGREEETAKHIFNVASSRCARGTQVRLYLGKAVHSSFEREAAELEPGELTDEQRRGVLRTVGVEDR